MRRFAKSANTAASRFRWPDWRRRRPRSNFATARHRQNWLRRQSAPPAGRRRAAAMSTIHADRRVEVRSTYWFSLQSQQTGATSANCGCEAARACHSTLPLMFYASAPARYVPPPTRRKTAQATRKLGAPSGVTSGKCLFTACVRQTAACRELSTLVTVVVWQW